MREFCTAGPIVPADHYHLPRLQRAGLEGVRHLVERKKYFVLRGPRQTGKTTALMALSEDLNRAGYRAVQANIQGTQTRDDDVGSAIRAILHRLATAATRAFGDDSFSREWRSVTDGCEPGDLLRTALGHWAASDPKPLVLLLDEVDSLRGETLLSVLHQLRAGYPDRPGDFPQSVALCGQRDAVDYSLPSASPFNIVDESLRLGDFSEDQVRALLGQHTEETGQPFAEEAIDEIWESSLGQPWLVNALAREACFRDAGGRDRSRALTGSAIRAAREQLILRAPAHFRQIADRLREERVRRVLDPILASVEAKPDFTKDDARYVGDIGLVTAKPPVRVANPIYREVIPRLLADRVEVTMHHDETRFLRDDGGLAVPELLKEFQRFFRENAEAWSRGAEYPESGAQVLVQAFLQRVVNAGGHIVREYGLGRGRSDLLISWRKRSEPQVFVIECKVRRKRDGLAEVIRRGALQTAGYVDRSGAEDGHLLVFGRDEHKSWEERLFHRRVRVRRTADAGRSAEEAREVVPEGTPPAEGEREIQVWGL